MALNTHNIIYAGLYIQKQKKCLILPSFQLYEYVRKEKSECVSHQAPRGALHIGGVRTALYNYLFAKQNHGDMIFRIEDTDSQRFVPGAEAYIIEALEWLRNQVRRRGQLRQSTDLTANRNEKTFIVNM